MNIKKGQKIDLTKGRSLPSITIGLTWQSAISELDINASAFLLNAAGKCAGDEDMIFYNQQTSRQQAVQHLEQEAGMREAVHISFGQMPADIARIALTLTIHEGEWNGSTFSQVKDTLCRLYNPMNGETLGTFNFGEGLDKETAIVIGELYLHQGEWKFAAIGSGFHGGLPALVTHYGLELAGEAQSQAAATAETAKPPANTAPSAGGSSAAGAESDAAEAGTASSTRVGQFTLDKKQSISISKSSRVTASLEWQKKRDLDLYCFYITQDNQAGTIYYRNLGAAGGFPYITLDGDSKTNGKETIIIHRPDTLKYVLFAAYSALSNGIGSFRSMKVRAVIDNHQGQVVTTPLHQRNLFSYWVAIAHIDFTDRQHMRISHVESYSKSHQERSPMLFKDGTFKMDVGPIEFKSNEWF
ncbi:TerD family protein [Paenibacillus sp. SYP-B4298]|uniref:TerD family protein n=1 Tax=Paenibacillus sp. SYP-B4298 TaxID=2996034 RepID=UPI0022DD1965|nr:TerD family protein [Paenibacillus sp. SYP-B4298]